MVVCCKEEKKTPIGIILNGIYFARYLCCLLHFDIFVAHFATFWRTHRRLPEAGEMPRATVAKEVWTHCAALSFGLERYTTRIYYILFTIYYKSGHIALL